MLADLIYRADPKWFLEVLIYTALKLMCILTPPDDESLGTGSPLARYCTERIDPYLYGPSLEYDFFEGLRSPGQVYF